MAATQFPVPLDNLIAYVAALHPSGGPLDNVSDAFTVSEQLEEQADALIGHFVDQARRSGASWSQIGAAMGVSKQAAQKRFVPGKGGFFLEGHDFSRFTDRARNVVTAAWQSTDGPVGAAHLTAALFVEPYGLAAKMFAAAGLTAEQACAAVGTGPAGLREDSTPPKLREVPLADDGQDALKGALKAALRLGHNYIGTEHILLGVLQAGGQAAEALGALGLTPERAEELFAAAIAEFQARRREAGGA
jgi:hypothetical protein